MRSGHPFIVITVASQVVLVVKNLPANAGDVKIHRFDSWVGKIPWRTAWQPHSSILAWRIPWTEEPGGLQSIGLQRLNWLDPCTWNRRVRAATQGMWPNGEGRTSTQNQKTSGKAQRVWTRGGKSHDELLPCDGRWRGDSPDLPGEIYGGLVGVGWRMGVVVGTWDVFKISLKKLHYPGMLLQDLIWPPAGCFYTLSLLYTQQIHMFASDQSQCTSILLYTVHNLAPFLEDS